jgi:phosphatidylserine/phosphatidylglycerophosphate/cardiolipin synthase-like enzyme
VREDGDPQSNMHHKFAIIDSIVVLTGSFNWTTMAAHYNEENVIIIGDKNVVKQYNAEFSKLWKLFEKCPVTSESKHKAYSKPY